MPIREGGFRHSFNPDTGTPLPRPFILEGEGKGRKGVALRPEAPPKVPTRPDIPGEPSEKDLLSIAWFKEFKGIESTSSVTKSPEISTLSEQVAKALGLKTGGGAYIRWVTGYKYNVLTGKMDIPIYEYKKVHPGILAQWESDKKATAAWANDPRKAMALARFFWKYGFKSDYYALKKWMVQRALAIRDEQKRAYYEWRSQEMANFNKFLDNWYRWRNATYR